MDKITKDMSHMTHRDLNLEKKSPLSSLYNILEMIFKR
jgi:hypothetical protein